jgi:P27 family predicted phage terminase small subunit
MPKTSQPFPEAPQHLSTRAQEVWRTMGPEKAHNPGRRLLLQSGLEALDRADQAREAIAREGMTTKTESTGAVHINPLVKVEREARGQAVKILDSIGFGAYGEW